MRLFFLLAAATGGRTDELLRQRWKNFNWEETTLNFPPEITKTNRVMTTPMLDGLANAIRKAASPSGELFPHFRDSKHLANTLAVFLPANKLSWKHYGFRHTTISAKVAIGQNISNVAEQHGTSEDMIKDNYQELMPKAQAAAWLNFVPAGTPKPKPKVVPFKNQKKTA